jgi:hypothetical protein
MKRVLLKLAPVGLLYHCNPTCAHNFFVCLTAIPKVSSPSSPKASASAPKKAVAASSGARAPEDEDGHRSLADEDGEEEVDGSDEEDVEDAESGAVAKKKYFFTSTLHDVHRA